MAVPQQMQQPRPGDVRQLLAKHSPDLFVLAWLVFMATASAWLPAYNGTIDSSERWAAGIRLIGVYLVIAAIAEIAVRARVPTRRGAVLACLPSLALLAAAAAGVFVGDLTADGRGSPLFLYFGVALWASWAALVLSTALVSRARWNRLAIALTMIVAIVGVVMAVWLID
jgi:hypothetical protein